MAILAYSISAHPKMLHFLLTVAMFFSASGAAAFPFGMKDSVPCAEKTAYTGRCVVLPLDGDQDTNEAYAWCSPVPYVNGDVVGSRCSYRLTIRGMTISLDDRLANSDDALEATLDQLLGTRRYNGNPGMVFSTTRLGLFYTVRVLRSKDDLCFVYETRFPFSGGARFCQSGFRKVSVSLAASTSLRDAVSQSLDEMGRRGLTRQDRQNDEPFVLDLRESDSGTVEYVVIWSGSWLRRPIKQYNFIIDAASKDLIYSESPFPSLAPNKD